MNFKFYFKRIIFMTIIIFIGLCTKNICNAATYNISSVNDLNEFASNVNNGKTYEGDEVILLNDIDFKGNEENEWVPIGIKEETPFKGTFNGSGHVIKNIFISKCIDDVKNYGLFGFNDGQILNLGVDGSITLTNNTKRIQCNLGGIAGTNYGSIKNCYNSIKLTADDTCKWVTGGIAGWNGDNKFLNKKATILNCYNNADIYLLGEKFSSCGTIIGEINYDQIELRNCYSIASIHNESNKGHIYNIALKGSENETMYNCYYLETNEYQYPGYSNGINPKSSNYMKTADFVDDLNVNTNAFSMDTKLINNGYPVLSWQNKEEIIEITGIKIKKSANKLDYKQDESFDTTGMIVVAEYSDGTSREITNYTIDPKDKLDINDKNITVSYTEDEKTYTAKQMITVKLVNTEKETNTLKETNTVVSKNETKIDVLNKDNTVSDKIIPQTGEKINCLFILMIILIAIIIFYKQYKKNKDIK